MCIQRFVWLSIAACSRNPAPGPDSGDSHADFGAPELVTIQGYDGLTEDPFITSDDTYLLFDDAGNTSGPITCHYATRIDYKTFAYGGEIQGIGGGASPATDSAGNFYWLSGRSYDQDFASIWHGTFSDGVVTNLASVASISKQQMGWFNMGATPSRDGTHLVFSDNGPRMPPVPNTPDGVSHIVIATKASDGTFTRDSDSDEILQNVNIVRGITDFTYDATLANDELEIFFTAPNPGDASMNPASIYVARRSSTTEAFGVANALDTGLATEGLAEGSTISSDGKHLYFHKVIFSPTSSQTAIYVLSRP